MTLTSFSYVKHGFENFFHENLFDVPLVNEIAARKLDNKTNAIFVKFSRPLSNKLKSNGSKRQQ